MKSGEGPAAPAVLFFSIYEDVSHGSSARLPDETAELNAVDMTAVGKTRSLQRLVLAYLLTSA